MMKSNCRKAAMETRQQHIQVYLGNVMAFDPHHSFPSIPFSKLPVPKPPTKWETFAITKGISPERWLCETLRTYKFVSCSISEGITPERELLLRSKLQLRCKLPICASISPLKWFWFKFRSCCFVICPSSGGIRPEILFQPIRIYVMLMHFPHCGESVPTNWFSLRVMNSRLGCTPNAFIMFPVNWFPSNRTLDNAKQFLKHSANTLLDCYCSL